jgi:hypothetical protein
MKSISAWHVALLFAAIGAIAQPACSAVGDAKSAAAGTGGGGGSAASGTGGTTFVSGTGGATCAGCKDDQTCIGGQCLDECGAAGALKDSVGCDYYAVDGDGYVFSGGGCFVSFIANTSKKAAHLQAHFGAAAIDLATYAKIPVGSGKALTYAPYDPSVGLAPGEIAILFLAYDPFHVETGLNPEPPVACPVPAAVTVAQVDGPGIGVAFRIQTDVPVVAYQMLPYGGGSAAVTGASLLLPVSVWGDNYVATMAYGSQAPFPGRPSMDIVAAEDDTVVTITPNVAIVGGPGVAAAPANSTVTYHLNQGQVLQFTQQEELTGSPIQTSKPVGLWAMHECGMVGQSACDHMEQQIPPISALGSEYAGVSYRKRTPTYVENPPWRVIGAVDGTVLTWEPSVGGPTKIDRGEVLEFNTYTPFVVRSQDKSHPFLLVTYMDTVDGRGDADFVRVIPPAQYLDRYVFFTDPTYPTTNLVVVRKRGPNGFADVELDCAGNLTDWTPLGAAGDYEFTRIDLIDGDFVPQGKCDNGRHEMTSTEQFGVTVWGWGGPETTGGVCTDTKFAGYTCYVSYGYPAGEGVRALNDVVVPAVPK